MHTEVSVETFIHLQSYFPFRAVTPQPFTVYQEKHPLTNCLSPSIQTSLIPQGLRNSYVVPRNQTRRIAL